MDIGIVDELKNDKMIISAIVASSENNIIGYKNEIPWRLSDDLKHFKRITLNHYIIMGRKTYESIKKPLTDRTNIVVTRNKNYIAKGCLIANSINEALNLAAANNQKEVFVIGGGSIYKESLELLDRIYMTVVHANIKGDAYFPVLDLKVWNQVSSVTHKASKKNDFNYTFKVFERLNKN